MAIYTYENPKTGEEFDELRPMSDSDKDFILEDGTVCKRVYAAKRAPACINKNAEVWERDPAYVRSLAPKYVRTQDGRRIKYNPNTMG